MYYTFLSKNSILYIIDKVNCKMCINLKNRYTFYVVVIGDCQENNNG